jgi:hypothetical protein
MYCTYSADGTYNCAQQNVPTAQSHSSIEHFAAAPTTFICSDDRTCVREESKNRKNQICDQIGKVCLYEINSKPKNQICSEEGICVDTTGLQRKTMVCDQSGQICMYEEKSKTKNEFCDDKGTCVNTIGLRRKTLVCDEHDKKCVDGASLNKKALLCTPSDICLTESVPYPTDPSLIFELNSFTLTNTVGDKISRWNNFTQENDKLKPIYREIASVPYVQFSSQTDSYMNWSFGNTTFGQTPMLFAQNKGATVVLVCRFNTYTKGNIALAFTGPPAQNNNNSNSRAFEWRILDQNKILPRFFHANKDSIDANIGSFTQKFAVFVYRLNGNIPQIYVNNKLQAQGRTQPYLNNAIISNCYIGAKPSESGNNMDVIYAAAFTKPLSNDVLTNIQRAFDPVLAVLNS